MSILTLLVIGPILSIVRNLHISQMLCEWKNIMLLKFNTNVVHSLDGTCNIQLWFQCARWLMLHLACNTQYYSPFIEQHINNNMVLYLKFERQFMLNPHAQEIFMWLGPIDFPLLAPCSILKISSNFFM